MEQFASSMQYGNPNRSYIPYLNTKLELDSLLPELTSQFLPSKEDSLEEIKVLIDKTTALSQDEELQKRFSTFDRDFSGYLCRALIANGLNKDDLEALLTRINLEALPLVFKVKYYYQRPRPFQFANSFNMALFPFRSITSDSPSYPSTLAYQARIYTEVIGNNYPNFYAALKKLEDDVCESRISMGLNYPTDITFAQYCADLALAHPDFKKKFKL